MESVVTSIPTRSATRCRTLVYRAVQVGSFAVTGTQVYAYHRRAQARIAAEQDHRARRALNAQIRAERDADRARWEPALDPGWLRRAHLLEAAEAWGAALPYTDRGVPWYEPGRRERHDPMRRTAPQPASVRHGSLRPAPQRRARPRGGDAGNRSAVRPPSLRPGRAIRPPPDAGDGGSRAHGRSGCGYAGWAGAG